jgi:hypothetical protein
VIAVLSDKPEEAATTDNSLLAETAKVVVAVLKNPG